LIYSLRIDFWPEKFILSKMLQEEVFFNLFKINKLCQPRRNRRNRRSYRSIYKELRFICHELYEDWHHFFHKFEDIYRNRFYSFLMGDINSITEWERMKRRYHKLFKHIQSLQIPHHGSKKIGILKYL